MLAGPMKFLYLTSTMSLALKIAALLAEYLSRHGLVELPGIGRFSLDIPADQLTGEFVITPEHLVFTYDASAKDNPELVSFIAERTGKLKALASADLDSHLMQVRQFLNIGKPYLFEGIGSLIKLQSGEYALAAGPQFHEKIKAVTPKEIMHTSTLAESFSSLRNAKGRTGQTGNRWRKPLIGLIVLAGLAIAIWGGYIIYKMAIAKNKANKSEADKVEAASLSDTALHQKDSIATVQVVSKSLVPTGNFKFILEMADSARINKRFSQLKAYQWPVQMEKRDSAGYTLFMILPASVSDTARIVDSLSAQNGRRVHIEQ